MTAEDIKQALRLTALGRANHPLQEQLAEKLAELFVARVGVGSDCGPIDISAVVLQEVAPKRRGRPAKKAE